MMEFTCPECIEDVEVDPVRIDGAQFNYRITCPTPRCKYETKANALPSVETFVRAKHYALLETGSFDGLRSFHHVDQFGVPGGTVDVFLCVSADGDVIWVVHSRTGVNLYRPENYSNIEAIVEEHANIERKLFAEDDE